MIDGFEEILWLVPGSIIETLMASLIVGSLFSQYHSGIEERILKLVLHSHPRGIFALAAHRFLMLSRSSLLGMNDDNFMK
jgi:hypothetical protein